jgi:phosphatidylethanolamine N-methyltransferase
MFRATDFSLVILLLYSLSTLVPPLPHRVGLTMHLLHALSWRIFHSFGLGLLLRAQSKSKWFVRHHLKHYHYPSDEAGGMQKEGVVKRATEEAFRNWQVVYNISLVMTYGESCDCCSWLTIVSFTGLAWKTYHLPVDWTVGGTLLRHVLGLVSFRFCNLWPKLTTRL